MKRAFLAVVAALFAFILLSQSGKCQGGNGDISGNGTLTLTDENMLRDYLLGKIALSAGQKSAADMNGDGLVDVADMVQVIARNPVTGTSVKMNSNGGTIDFDGASATVPSGLLTATTTTLTLSVQPISPTIGEDTAGATVRVSIPLASINRAKLAVAAQAARQRRAAARASQGGAYRMGPSISDFIIKFGNEWGSIVAGDYYIAAQYTLETGDQGWLAMFVDSANASELTGHLTADVLEALVNTAQSAGKMNLDLAFTVVLAAQFTLSPPSLLDWSNPSEPEATPSLGAHRNIVLFVHGINSKHQTWKQVVQGFVGQYGNSPDPALNLDAGSLGAWVYEFDFRRSTQLNGADLADALNAFVSAHDSEIDNIYIVAHSQGGLIVRRALDAAKNGTPQQVWLGKVRATAYLGSMHQGADLQAFGTVLLNLISFIPQASLPADAIQALYLNTPGMNDLAEDIPASIGVPDPSLKVRTYLIGSHKESILTKFYFNEPNDGWVRLKSAIDNPVVDYAELSASNKIDWPITSGGIWSKWVWLGGHVLLFPNADDPGGNNRSLSEIRGDDRYTRLRDFLFPDTGLITIDITPDNASWELTGPAGFTTTSGSGDRLGSNAISAPAGNYTLHCNPLTSHTAPADETRALARGGAIAFTPELPILIAGELTPAVNWVISRDYNNLTGAGATGLGVSTRSGINRHARTLIQFDLSSLAGKPLVTSAKVRLYARSQSEYVDNDVHLSRVVEDWDSGVATWTARKSGIGWSTLGGGYTSQDEAVVRIPSKYTSNWHYQTGDYNEWFEWDVTQIVRGWQSGSLPNNGLLLWETDIANSEENQSLGFAPIEDPEPALRPRLILNQ